MESPSQEGPTRGERVLLTGATGFVGRHVLFALRAAGYRVRCATRSPEAAAARDPQSEWVRFDLDDPESVAPALAGCGSALFLVHAMGGASGGDYPEREREEALRFREAARSAGLRRVVYLGGVTPQGAAPSKHLQSRLDTGEVLRSGGVSTIELRAAMVIGAGSAGWQMVHDLAQRLPAMLLPRWLRNFSWPVSIDDVAAALLGALADPSPGSAWYELPGPERIAHRELMRRVAGRLGKRPLLLSVPVLSPRLSSYWIALVTSTEFALIRELVEGIRHDLDPSGPLIWERIPAYARLDLETSITRALRDQRYVGSVTAEHQRELAEIGLTFALG